MLTEQIKGHLQYKHEQWCKQTNANPQRQKKKQDKFYHWGINTNSAIITASAIKRREKIHIHTLIKINVVPVLNYALHHEGIWRRGYIDPYFLDLGPTWRWMVSFTPRPLYPREKNSRYPLDRRLGGPQNRSGRHGEVKILAFTGTRSLGR
jgi:hypothetical protein